MLEDIWPSDEEINSVISQVITPEMFKERYEDVLEEPRWESIPSKKSAQYEWDKSSTYVRLPTFFDGIKVNPEDIRPVEKSKSSTKVRRFYNH